MRIRVAQAQADQMDRIRTWGCGCLVLLVGIAIFIAILEPTGHMPITSPEGWKKLIRLTHQAACR